MGPRARPGRVGNATVTFRSFAARRARAGGTEGNTVKYAYDIIGRFMFVELKKKF
jgi:hypothetical protein